MAQDIIKKITERNKSYFTIKEKEQLIKDTKATFISLAYTDILSSRDILELSEIMLTISKYKTPNKKNGL